MVNTVIKRDGRKVPFDSQKIYNAVSKASLVVDKTLCSKVTDLVTKELTAPEVSVEYIQDLVEQILVEMLILMAMLLWVLCCNSVLRLLRSIP